MVDGFLLLTNNHPPLVILMELGGAAAAATAIAGALRRPRLTGEGQAGPRGRRTTGLRLRNGQGWQGLLFARCEIFALCTFWVCVTCGELWFCVEILSNKCGCFLFLRSWCVWGMRRRATWDGHRLNAPACIVLQARAMWVVVSSCFLLYLHIHVIPFLAPGPFWFLVWIPLGRFRIW